jgi:outer membrane protein assembly factor BamB
MSLLSRWDVSGRVIRLAGVVVVSASLAGAQSWPQWALNPQHTSQIFVVGQFLNRELADIVYDPLVPDEMAANGGALLAHYQVPLIDNSTSIFMEFKSGTYNKNRYATQIWGENGFQWTNGQLVQVWSFVSDWKAPGSQADFWEPVFHGVLANGYIYVPGAGGTIFKLRKTDGSVISRINPFSTFDPAIVVASVPTVDVAGNIYYNAIQRFNSATGASFYAHDIVDSWLVKVSPGDVTAKVSYSVLTAVTAPNSLPAPGPTDQCLDVFDVKQLPWPPSPDAVPPTFTCGHMRPALNAAPAIAPDGTIYTITRTHLGDGSNRYGGMAAVHPDLTPKWWTSFRDRLNDGCNNDAGTFAGALLPANGSPGGCRPGTTPGVDPAQNTQPGARVLDDASSSPTIAPDGSILYGSYTRYDFARGHLLKFGSTGAFLGAYSFGWDSTPAIYQHDGTYSIIIKDNEYGGGPNFGSYCNVDSICPPRQNGPFFITQLDPNLNVEWKFQNTNNQACSRNADGTVTCKPNTSGNQWPNVGFEWCINAPVVDANGVVYANSEDGNLYAINQGGTPKANIFLQLALGAAYTPLAIGPDGKIYTENEGHLIVVGE